MLAESKINDLTGSVAVVSGFDLSYLRNHDMIAQIMCAWLIDLRIWISAKTPLLNLYFHSCKAGSAAQTFSKALSENN